MKRLGMVWLAVAVVLVAASAAWPLTQATAQGTDKDATIAALQTQVAALQTRVANASRPAPSTAPAGAPATPTGPLGSRTNPVPFGQPHAVGADWTVAVTHVDRDALAAIQAENQFNAPPPPGKQFVMVTVRATYHGSQESAQLPFSMEFNAVGASGVAYDFSLDCGLIPNQLPISDVFQGGTVEGNVCWAVKTKDVASLVMYAEPLFTLNDERVFFSLRSS